jgi:hypothetical protein
MGDRASPAEKLATTANFNHFEVRSGEYNMIERPPDSDAVNWWIVRSAARC